MRRSEAGLRPLTTRIWRRHDERSALCFSPLRPGWSDESRSAGAKRAAIFVGPELGTESSADLVAAACGDVIGTTPKRDVYSFRNAFSASGAFQSSKATAAMH